jgi:hypothetical protein
MECFCFPSNPTQNERRELFNFASGSSDSNALHFFGNGSENGSTFSDPFEDEPIDWSSFQDENLLKFLNSPFTEVQMQADDIFAPMFMDPNFSHAGLVTGMPCPPEWDPASVQSAAIIQGLRGKASLLNLNPQEQTDLSQHLDYIFTPSRIERMVSLYFEFWHPHCPIIYRPTFSIETTPTPLLISMTLMGVMYSQVDHEVKSGKILLDLAEMFVFSASDLTEESEIQRMLRASLGSSPDQSGMLSSMALQNLQAAYVMVCLQFWAGNPVARRRAIERFAVVVKVMNPLRIFKLELYLTEKL